MIENYKKESSFNIEMGLKITDRSRRTIYKKEEIFLIYNWWWNKQIGVGNKHFWIWIAIESTEKNLIFDVYL